MAAPFAISNCYITYFSIFHEDIETFLELYFGLGFKQLREIARLKGIDKVFHKNGVFSVFHRSRMFGRRVRRVSASHAHDKIESAMSYPIKTCVVCGEEFELRPGKPGFANRCPACSEEESADLKSADPKLKRTADADQRKTDREANEARREAMRNLLYRKDS